MLRALRPIRLPHAFLYLLLPAVLLLVAIVWRPGQAQQPATPDNSHISCENNPFGSMVDVFPENEIFVSFTAVGGFQPNLSAAWVDVGQSNFGDYADLDELGLYTENANPGLDVGNHAAAAADLNGDGNTAFIQTFTNDDTRLVLAYHDPTTDPLASSPTYVETSRFGATHLTAAAGNLIGEDSEREQVVSAYRFGDSVRVELYEEGPSASEPLSRFASWSSGEGARADAALLDVAVGNFNNNPRQDIALVLFDNFENVEILILEYDPADGQLHLLAEEVTFVGSEPYDVQVAAASLNGDFQDEVILAYDGTQFDVSYSPLLNVSVFTYEVDDTGPDILTEAYSWTDDTNSTNFGMAAGDVNGDMREEISLVYPSAGSDVLENALYVQVLELKALETPSPYLDNYAHRVYPWDQSGGERDQAEYLSVAVGDIDPDDDLGMGAQLKDEIVVAIDDGRGLEILYIDHEMLLSSSESLPDGHHLDLDPQELNSKTDLVLGDRDNDTVKGDYDGSCEEVTDRRVTAVMYNAPIWPNIQNGDVSWGAIGRGQSVTQHREEAMSYSRSHTTSGYVGVGVSASYGVGSFEASVRGTASETYGSSDVRASSVYSSASTSVEHFAYNDFATTEETTYHCYSYDVVGPTITGTATFNHCEYIDSAQQPTNLNAWDRFYGYQLGNEDSKLAATWAPVVRDWASLSLFRDGFAGQSSTDAAAGLAVDGQFDTAARTLQENDPYWEVDLGASHPIQKVRLWNGRQPDGCLDPSVCPDLLDDFYLFISDEPFSSDDPAVLAADPGVVSYTLASLSDALPTDLTGGPAGRVTTFLTLEDNPDYDPNEQGSQPVIPIDGRYVRVQINRDNAVLTLAELQVFGADPLSPDRHPVAVEDNDPQDGIFTAEVYNPYTDAFALVQARGRLLWDGDDQLSGSSVLDGQAIGVGGGDTFTVWSYSQEHGTEESRAESFSWETSTGYEVSASAGAIVQVEAGYGEEWTSGVTRETTHEISWGEEFEMAGAIPHFPDEYTTWVLKCQYQVRLFYYELTEISSFGIETRYPVLDYLVPEGSGSHLDRDGEDLADCRNGNQTADEPNATNDETVALAGGDLTFTPLANDFGNNLSITGVTDPMSGTVRIDGRRIIYMPNPGFLGEDGFDYTISDGEMTSTSTVTVVVEPQRFYMPAVNRP